MRRRRDAVFSDNEATERSLRLIPVEFITGSTDLALASVAAAGQRGDRYETVRWLALADTLAGTDPEMQRKVAIARGLFHFGEIQTGLEWLDSAYRSDHSDDIWFVFQASIAALLSLWVRGPTQQVRAQSGRARRPEGPRRPSRPRPRRGATCKARIRHCLAGTCSVRDQVVSDGVGEPPPRQLCCGTV
jgi:hypothetical protein